MNKNQNDKDPKEMFESLVFEHKRKLSNRLQNYITYGVSRVDHYDNQKKIFLEMNFTIMIILGAILSVFFGFLDDKGKWIIFIILIAYSVLTILNILFNLEEHSTRSFRTMTRYDEVIKFLFRCKDIEDVLKEDEGWNSLWFYRGNILSKMDFESLYNFATERFKGKVNRNNNKNIIDLSNQLIRDDIKELYKLYFYQANYYRLALWTRNITIYSILYLIITFITLIIVFIPIQT